MKFDQHCGNLIRQIHSTVEKRANNQLREDDLTFSQVAVLLALDEKNDHQMTFKELEKVLNLAQSTTNGIISRLEQKGFISSYTDHEDKRIKWVRIMPAGENQCRNAEWHMLENEKQLLSGLTDSEKVVFYDLLTKVYEAIK